MNKISCIIIALVLLSCKKENYLQFNEPDYLQLPVLETPIGLEELKRTNFKEHWDFKPFDDSDSLRISQIESLKDYDKIIYKLSKYQEKIYNTHKKNTRLFEFTFLDIKNKYPHNEYFDSHDCNKDTILYSINKFEINNKKLVMFVSGETYKHPGVYELNGNKKFIFLALLDNELRVKDIIPIGYNHSHLYQEHNRYFYIINNYIILKDFMIGEETRFLGIKKYKVTNNSFEEFYD